MEAVSVFGLSNIPSFSRFVSLLVRFEDHLIVSLNAVYVNCLSSREEEKKKEA